MSRKYTVILLEQVKAQTLDRDTTGEYGYAPFNYAYFKVSVKSHTDFDGIAKFGYAPHGQKIDHSSNYDQYIYLLPDTEIDSAYSNQNFNLHEILQWKIGESYEVYGHIQPDKYGHHLVIEDSYW